MEELTPAMARAPAADREEPMPGLESRSDTCLCSRGVHVGCCVAALAVGVEYGIINPTIYQYLRSLGPKPELHMGVCCAVFSFARVVTYVPLGHVADRCGARAPSAGFFLLAALGNLYYFVARRPMDVVLSRAVVGLGSSVSSVLCGVVGACQGSKRERNSQLQRLRSLPFSTRFG